MTNVRQVKEIFEPLMSRHGDLKKGGTRMLVLVPVHHLALRIFIERSYGADYPNVQWHIMELFRPDRNVKNGLGHRNILRRPETSKEQLWMWSDPTMIEDALFVLENEALPLMRSMQHFETYAAYYYFLFGRSYFEYAENCLVVDIAMGDLKAARKKCESLLPEYRENKYLNWPQWQSLRTKVVTVAEPLMADDRAALAEILHGWEYDNVKGTILERYWKRTPFPLEL